MSFEERQPPAQPEDASQPVDEASFPELRHGHLQEIVQHVFSADLKQSVEQAEAERKAARKQGIANRIQVMLAQRGRHARTERGG